MTTENNEILAMLKEYVELSKEIDKLNEKKEAAKNFVKGFFKDGDNEIICGGYKAQLRHSVTKTLKADLIKKVLGVDVTDDCYKITSSSKFYAFENKDDENK